MEQFPPSPAIVLSTLWVPPTHDRERAAPLGALERGCEKPFGVYCVLFELSTGIAKLLLKGGTEGHAVTEMRRLE